MFDRDGYAQLCGPIHAYEDAGSHMQTFRCGLGYRCTCEFYAGALLFHSFLGPTAACCDGLQSLYVEASCTVPLLFIHSGGAHVA
jgi:hypothetical protein